MGPDPEKVKQAYEDLWKDFGRIEAEFDKGLIKINELSKEFNEKNELMNNLLSLRDQKDKKIEYFKVKLHEVQRKLTSIEMQAELLERYMNEDRLAKDAALDTIAMFKADLTIARDEVRLRDYWFTANKQLMDTIIDILQQRRDMIKAARRGPVEFIPEDDIPTEEIYDASDLLRVRSIDNGIRAIVKPFPQTDMEERTKQFCGCLVQELKDHISDGKALEIVLIRMDDSLDPGNAILIDNTPLLVDNNLLLCVARARRGFSLALGKIDVDETGPATPDLTEDPYYEQIIGRMEIKTQLDDNDLNVKIAHPDEMDPHPDLILAVNVGISYLAQNPEMKLSLTDMIINKQMSMDEL